MHLVVGYSGQVRFDRTKPDGTPRKALNVSKLEDLGWKASIRISEGIASTYEWYVENMEIARL